MGDYDRLIGWIEDNYGLEYDDLSDVDDMIQRLSDQAERQATSKQKVDGFKEAIDSEGFKEEFLEPAQELQEEIEEADFSRDLPAERVEKQKKIFKDRLTEGIEGKKSELDQRWEEELSGEILGSSRSKEIERTINKAKQIKLPDEVVDRLEELGEDHKKTLVEEPIIEALKRADTVEEVADVDIPSDLPPESIKKLKQFKGLRTAEEKVEDFVGPIKEKWPAADALAGLMVERIEDAQTADEVLTINWRDLPTQKGRDAVRKAVDRKFEELASKELASK